MFAVRITRPYTAWHTADYYCCNLGMTYQVCVKPGHVWYRGCFIFVGECQYLWQLDSGRRPRCFAVIRCRMYPVQACGMPSLLCHEYSFFARSCYSLRTVRAVRDHWINVQVLTAVVAFLSRILVRVHSSYCSRTESRRQVQLFAAGSQLWPVRSLRLVCASTVYEILLTMYLPDLTATTGIYY